MSTEYLFDSHKSTPESTRNIAIYEKDEFVLKMRKWLICNQNNLIHDIMFKIKI